MRIAVFGANGPTGRHLTDSTGAMAGHGIQRLLAVSSRIADPNWRPTAAHFWNEGVKKK